MLRKATQLLLLPVLFALLAAGGKVTMCEALSIVGLEVHHHHYREAEANMPHPGPFCPDSHERGGLDHDHHHDEVPCPETCEIQFSEAPAPVLLKVPAASETYLLPFLLEVLLASEVPGTLFRAFDVLEPPDQAAPFTDPTFTGRFLV